MTAEVRIVQPAVVMSDAYTLTLPTPEKLISTKPATTFGAAEKGFSKTTLIESEFVIDIIRVSISIVLSEIS